MIFGVNTDKLPVPVSVKKILLVHLAAGILAYDIEKYKKSGDSKRDGTYEQIYACLAFTRNLDGRNTNPHTLSDNAYWSMISTRESTK